MRTTIIMLAAVMLAACGNSPEQKNESYQVCELHGQRLLPAECDSQRVVSALRSDEPWFDSTALLKYPHPGFSAHSTDCPYCPACRDSTVAAVQRAMQADPPESTPQVGVFISYADGHPPPMDPEDCTKQYVSERLHFAFMATAFKPDSK